MCEHTFARKQKYDFDEVFSNNSPSRIYLLTLILTASLINITAESILRFVVKNIRTYIHTYIIHSRLMLVKNNMH
jgi:hypothetical protein